MWKACGSFSVATTVRNTPGAMLPGVLDRSNLMSPTKNAVAIAWLQGRIAQNEVLRLTHEQNEANTNETQMMPHQARHDGDCALG